MAKNPYGSDEPVAIEKHEGECRACDDTGWVPYWAELKPCPTCQPDKHKRWEAGEDVEFEEATQ